MTIPFDQITPNSILVIRDDTLGDDEERKRTLRAQLPHSVDVVTMARATDVLCISETTLNAAGWFRH